MNGDLWPVYTGKSFNLWNPDTEQYYASADPNLIKNTLHGKRKNQHKIKRSVFFYLDNAVVQNISTLPCLRPRIAFRDVTNSTNSRSLIVALIPGRVVTVDKSPYLFLKESSNQGLDTAFILGVLSSMILDWLVRRVVELKLGFYILNNLPFPDIDSDYPPDSVEARVVEIAGRLGAPDKRFTDWAREVGVSVGSVKSEYEKQDLIHELDACVAHLYGLDEADLEILYGTFHANTNYFERHAAVLEHFRRMA